MIKEKILEADGKVAVVREQDTEDIFDYIRQRTELGAPSFGGEGYHAATVPKVVLEDYCYRNGITWEELMQNPEHSARLLNDPDFRRLRIWRGRV